MASGAGAISRHAIGTPVFGGMLTETMVGIYVTPVLFVLLTLWSESFRNMIFGKPEESSTVPAA